jgi:hypothetical protein
MEGCRTIKGIATLSWHRTGLDWTVILHKHSLTFIHVCTYLLPSFIPDLCFLVQASMPLCYSECSCRHESCNRVPRSIKNKPLFDRLGPSTMLSPRTDMPFRQSSYLSSCNLSETLWIKTIKLFTNFRSPPE